METIKKLRNKFILNTMAVLSLVLIVIIGGVNVAVSAYAHRESVGVMLRIVDGDGQLSRSDRPDPDHRAPGHPFGLSLPFDIIDMRNYFSVLVDADGEVRIVSTLPLFSSREEVMDYLDQARATGEAGGTVDGHRFLAAEKPEGTLYVFLDNRAEQNTLTMLLQVSLIVFATSMLLAFVAAWYLSGKMVRPVQDAFERQRRFVADASHELKTPITVIGANADVLAGEIGENKWLGYIRSEAARMNRLVADLLYLAKYDGGEERWVMCDFSLSSAVYGAVLPFESLVYESGRSISTDIADGLTLHGEERRITQLVMILLDNAVKNSYEGSEIRVTLRQNGDKRLLTVENQGEGIPAADLPHIFERFYRADTSRSRETGGYGLGLTIAQSIVAEHGGRIGVTSAPGGWTVFTVTL